jgi:hypothetical protein
MRIAVWGAFLVVALLSTPARAFCGFFVAGADAELLNDATTVVLMRHDTRTALSMQNNYRGPVGDFAMVVPVPVVLRKANVKTLPADVFEHIDKLSSPRLVEYWERDPCWRPKVREYDDDDGYRVYSPADVVVSRAAPAVVVEAQFEVGEYDFVR